MSTLFDAMKGEKIQAEWVRRQAACGGWLLSQLKNGMQFSASSSRNAGVLIGFVEVNSFAQAVEISGAIGTICEMLLQLSASCGIEAFCEIFTKIRGHLFAVSSLALHDFMYP